MSPEEFSDRLKHLKLEVKLSSALAGAEFIGDRHVVVEYDKATDSYLVTEGSETRRETYDGVHST